MAASDVDARIVRKIFALLAARAPGKTICPSEAARALWPRTWRGRMDEVRRVGAELARLRKIDVCQKGTPVAAATARGPIRYRLR